MLYLTSIHTNYVCLSIQYPDNPSSISSSQCMFHREGEIIVFDDSKIHGAFNDSPTDFRVVLIVDMERPPGMPLGTAKGGHTDELDSFVSQFR